MTQTLVKATPQVDAFDAIFDKHVSKTEDLLLAALFDDTMLPQYIGQLVTLFDAGMYLPSVDVDIEKAGKWQTVRNRLLGEQRLHDINLAAEDYAATSAADLVADLTVQQANAVNSLVAKGIGRGWTDDTLARQLQRVIGLDDRYANAVSLFHQNLLDAGNSHGTANARADEYAQTLLKARTRAIARTEVARAINAGQRAVWLGAVDEGLVGNTIRTQWVLHPSERTCAECRDRSGSVSSPLFDGGKFYGGIDGPPLHPNCRCTERIVDKERSFAKHYEGVPGKDHDQLEHGVWNVKVHGKYDGPTTPGTTNIHEHDKLIKSLPKTRGPTSKTSKKVQLATQKEVLAVREKQAQMALKAKKPTDWDIVSNAIVASRRRVAHGPRNNGNVDSRRARAVKMVKAFGDGSGRAIDSYTGRLLTPAEFTEDKIIVAKYGGKYTQDNLIPTHLTSNQTRGDKDFPFGRPKWFTESFRRHAETLFGNTDKQFEKFYTETGDKSQAGFLTWAKAHHIKMPEIRNAREN